MLTTQVVLGIDVDLLNIDDFGLKIFFFYNSCVKNVGRIMGLSNLKTNFVITKHMRRHSHGLVPAERTANVI